MSVATPTVLQRPPRFPRLMPQPPKPHPVPLPKQGHDYGHFNAFRDLQRELDDLSDEENAIEDMNLHIQNRGFSFLIPIGRTLTLQEEKNDADEDDESDSSGSGTGGVPSVMEDDGGDDSAQDLDASMEDMDDEDDESEDEDIDEDASSDV